MSLRCLILGVFRDGGSGYCRAATECVLALQEAGVDVAVRTVYFHSAKSPIHPRLADLERKRFDSIDCTLFHLPPYAYHRRTDGGRNIGTFYFETAPVPSLWARRASLMDGLFVTDRLQHDVLRASPGFDPAVPVDVVPLPCEIARYARSYPRVPRFEAFRDGRFLFYTVGELVKRKNLSGLLRAYYAEFRPHEPVGLVVKASLGGKPTEFTAARLAEMASEVRRGMKLDDTPPVYFIPERLTDDELMALHVACDVFVQPSCGESWSYPAMDAMALGKTPVVSACGGYPEYIDPTVGWLVPTRREPCFAEGDTHAELFGGRQTWLSPDPMALQRAMREAYLLPASEREPMAGRGMERAEQFSHGRVGARLLQVLKNEQGCPPGRLAEGP